MIKVQRFGIVAALAWAASTAAHAQTAGETLRAMLEAGQAAEAVTTLRAAAVGEAGARMSLGFGAFTLAVEKLVGGLYRHGLLTPQNPFLPVMRLPIPLNVRPEPVDYQKLRAIYQTFVDDLKTAGETLASVPQSDAKLVLDLEAIKLKLPSRSAEGLTELPLRNIFEAVRGGQRGRQAALQAEPWVVAFDHADTLWLQGYTHIVSALFEFVLAHNWETTFDATAHLFFSGARPPAGISTGGQDIARMTPEMLYGGVADQIAFLHLIHWPAGDRVRLSAVRTHLKSAVALSRKTWDAVLAETDDDREWLPSPRQSSQAVPSLPITDEMIAGWRESLDDFDAVLDGKTLIPHWRMAKGINLRKVFEEPQPFDLVLWATGHGVMPFVDDGDVLSTERWGRINRIFRGNLLGYAVFIN
jgi:hypothetical protein